MIKKTSLFLAFLFLSKLGLAQRTDNSNRGKHKIDTLQESETPFFIDDETEAKFPGGTSAWTKFLKKNVRQNIPIKNGAPNGTYKVIVSFVVAKNGKISNIKAVTNFGHGMEKEVIGVIQKKP